MIGRSASWDTDKEGIFPTGMLVFAIDRAKHNPYGPPIL